jgi:hypothetical protein
MRFFETKTGTLLLGLLMMGVGIYELIKSISLLPGAKHILGIVIWSILTILGLLDVLGIIKSPKKEE